MVWFSQELYLENLVLDQNYTLSAFIDLNENYDPGDHDNTFEEGEPFDELNITLNADTYGLKLIPVDSAPVLEFYDPADSDETVSYEDSFSKVVIDVNGTEQTTSFAWTAKATDLLIENPWYVDSFLENNGSTPIVGQRIIVDGNFTEYIDQNFSGSAKILDLANTPWGFYELGFTAVDDHENLSSRLAQTIEIRDAQAPFLTLLETYVSEGIKPRVLTTESNESIDRVIAQQDLSSYDITYALTNDANWTWPLGVPFIIDGDDATLLVNIRDNKDGEIEDLNFTHAYGSEGNFTNNTGTFDLEFFAQDNAGNEMNVTLALEVVAELETEVTGIDGYLQGAEVIFDADGDGISDLNRVFRSRRKWQRNHIFFPC